MKNQNSRILEIWFEFASTYSYLSVSRIEDFAKSYEVKILWRPFLLGPIFKEQGWNDSPFNLYPAKGQYMWRDMERQCFKYGLPFQRPSQFPRNGLLAARVALALLHYPQQAEFIRQVFRANFAFDRDIADQKLIEEILKGLNLDSTFILQQALSTENKAKLREQTQVAKSLGIFGAPSFIVDDELFWGNDRLQEALEWKKRTVRIN